MKVHPSESTKNNGGLCSMSEKNAKKLKINPKTLLIDVLYDIIGSVLYGAGMYTFAVSSNFAP
ncbi:MAG TPA: hypothetical protein DCY17_00195, partial [Clostridiales bacterium]|nr:hypothetical protein [Clostridiales bacterium]